MNDRWIALEMAGQLAALLAVIPDNPAEAYRRSQINESIDRLIGAADDPDWVAPWKEQKK